MIRNRHARGLLALAVLAASVACADRTLAPTAGDARLSVGISLAGTIVATVIVDVTAPDIPTPLVFNIPIINGTASGTITIPAGSNRTISIQAFDAGGVETHSGTTTVNVQAGTNTSLSIVLTPLTGQLPITATLGSYVVGVAPTSATVHLSGTDTVRLTATIQDTQGNTVTGVVSWATLNPGIAVVDSTGLVTGTATGSTSISAVFNGVTGVASITVAP
ncbi:MAG TPA: Ig-like domain-containing protein [Gemmatimonadales bacterium]|nr:Ig-like domain-containing protein [Gemmatimonadales bacterium]